MCDDVRQGAAVVNDRTLYLVCGLPGSGKTTRARRIVDTVGAVHVSADEWIVRLGISLVDFEFRVKLQGCLLEHAGELLRRGIGVVIEFGSWHRNERETIRRVGVQSGAKTELHFLDAGVEELARRVRARGGPDAEALASTVLERQAHRFERPTSGEIASFDRYVGPGEQWDAARRY